MVVSNIKQITDQGVRVVKLERVHIYCYEMHDGLHIGLVTNLVVIVSVKKYQTDRQTFYSTYTNVHSHTNWFTIQCT